MGQDPGNLARLAWDYKNAWDNMGKKRARDLGHAGDFESFLTADRLILKGNNYSLDVNLKTMQAYELDKKLPRNLNLLMGMINNPDSPAEGRAKILEVVILRGAINRISYYEIQNFRERFSADWSAYEERQQYQAAAMTAVLYGQPELFDHLSRSADTLPQGRAPATEWMNTMMREGGLLGAHAPRQQVEEWMKNLPPETRGRAMYHLRDAAEAKEIGKVGRLTGFEVSAGEVGFGLQWEYGPDTHWKQVGDDLLLGVTRDLDQKPDQKTAFYTGYQKADPGLEDPKDFAKGGK